MNEKTMTPEEKEKLKKEAEQALKLEEEKKGEKQMAFDSLRNVQAVVKDSLLNEKDRNMANNSLLALNNFILKY